MSDRRLLLVALALVARPLVAQDDIALLRRRVANLEARRELLARAVARQDSATIAAQSLRVVGVPPFEVAVPATAAANAGAAIARVAAGRRARFGSLLDRLPAETLTVAFYPVRVGSDGNTFREGPAALVDRLDWEVGKWIDARVVALLPESLFIWTGRRLPSANGEGERVRALNTLLSDPTGRGVRCLEGELTTCRALLVRGPKSPDELRQSLLASVVERGGSEAWGRMANGGTVEAALVRGGDAPMDSVVSRWVDALHYRGAAAPSSPIALLFAGIGWALLFAVLVLWRIKWLHV